MRLIAPAAVDDQSAVEEAVQADPRASAAPREPGERLDARGRRCPASARSAAGDGQAELGADAEPDMLGGALTIWIRGRGSPRKPSGCRLVAESADQLARPGRPAGRRRSTRVPARPSARGRAPRSSGRRRRTAGAPCGPQPSRPKWRRLGVRIAAMSRHGRAAIGSGSSLVAGGLVHVLVQEAEGRVLGRAAGLVDEDGELAELGEDLGQGQEGRPRGQDRRLDHGVLGAVEAEEVAEPALGDGLGDDPSSARRGRPARRPGTRSSGRRRRGSGPRRRRPAAWLGGGSTGAPIAVWASSRTSSVTWKTPSPRAFRFR